MALLFWLVLALVLAFVLVFVGLNVLVMLAGGWFGTPTLHPAAAQTAAAISVRVNLFPFMAVLLEKTMVRERCT